MTVYFWYDTVLFGRTAIAMDSKCCTLCGGRLCDACADGVLPPELMVEISGVTAISPPACVDGCDSWNGTFILARDNSSPCYFRYTSTATVCGGQYCTETSADIEIRVTIDVNGGNTGVHVFGLLSSLAPDSEIAGTKYYTGLSSCSSWNATQCDTIQSRCCDKTGASITFTSLW